MKSICCICTGGPLKSCFPNINPESSYIDEIGVWRHKKCEIVVGKEDQKCQYCFTLKNSLRIHSNRKLAKSQHRIRLNLSPMNMASVKILQKAKANLNRKLKASKKKNQEKHLELKRLKSQLHTLNEASLTEDIKNLHLSEAQKLIISECISVGRKASKNGVRYTNDWLLLCLLIYIRNSSMYKFLHKHKILPLPCITTIRKYLNTVKLKCGFDNEFFTALKCNVGKKSNLECHGMLIWDEIQVRKSVAVNSKTMQYYGTVDFGDQLVKENDLADHGLVFMYQPFLESWTQPIAVFASKGSTKSLILIQLLLHAILLLEEAGVFIDGIVSDGASTNRGVWKHLGISGKLGEEKSYFTNPADDSRKIFVFSDVPHLIKNIRNRFLSKKILKLNNNTYIDWAHYQILFEEDIKLPNNLRICPKLTLSHIKPTNGEKMRVKLATQLFSNAVADGLKFYRSRFVKDLKHSEATVEFTLQMNNMFDALNRNFPSEGIFVDSKDIVTLKNSLEWLNLWEKEKLLKHINDD